jgi:nitroreductase
MTPGHARFPGPIRPVLVAIGVTETLELRPAPSASDPGQGVGWPITGIGGGSMEVFEAARTVLAVREYRDDPVPEDVVRRIVEAARLTGSSQNGQPWHFVVVTDREQLRRVTTAVPHGKYGADAALAIVVAVERTNRFGLSDASRAIQSMILTAWSEGVGSNWTGFTGMDQVRSILDIPEEYDVVAVVPFGYPARPLGKGRKRRKPMADVASRERFGSRFPE